MSLPVFYPPFPEPKTLDEFYMNHVRMWADYVYTNWEKPNEIVGVHPVCTCYACEWSCGLSCERCKYCPILFETSNKYACEEDEDSPYKKWRKYNNMPVLDEEDVLEMQKLCLDIANLTWTNPGNED